MAKIIPKLTAEEILELNESQAEVLVYEALSTQLSSTWTVLYSVPWIMERRRLPPRPGEADFVLFHPQHGMLVLEVKGGGIKNDRYDGKWYQTGGPGGWHDIEDPFIQAERSKFLIRNRLESISPGLQRAMPMGHGALFPDGSAGSMSMGLNVTPELVGFVEALNDINGWIERLAAFWKRNFEPERKWADEIERFTKLLLPPVEIRIPLGAKMRDQEQTVKRLTVEQYKILSFLSAIPRARIHGGAGTGKTMLALEKARDLAAKGYRTLLTCYNRPLGRELTRAAEKVDGLVAAQFHVVCGQLMKEAGLSLTSQRDQKFFNELLPFGLATAADSDPTLKFDAIVVDEGQDFIENWWVALEVAHSGAGDGTYYIFYDDNQRLYENAQAMPEFDKYLLTENVRNTGNIHSVASRYYQGADYSSKAPPGTELTFVHAVGAKETRRELSKLLHRLCTEERIPEGDIVVLFGSSIHPEEVVSGESIGAFKYVRADDDQDIEIETGQIIKRQADVILVDTVRRFKGLERPVAIVCGLDGDDDEAIYVAVTRARSHLVVMGSKNLWDRILA